MVTESISRVFEPEALPSTLLIFTPSPYEDPKIVPPFSGEASDVELQYKDEYFSFQQYVVDFYHHIVDYLHHMDLHLFQLD